MVDVTCENFLQYLPEIEAKIQVAAFVAIDTEFTCLLSDETLSNKLFDSSEERYSKQRQNLEKTSINQLGIAIYTPVAGENKFTAHVYNIYVKPAVFLDVDGLFLCQASSLAFLACHGFDFNKWLRSGVSCLSRTQRESVVERLHQLDAGSTTRTATARNIVPLRVRDELRNVHNWMTEAAEGEVYTIQRDGGAGGGATQRDGVREDSSDGGRTHGAGTDDGVCNGWNIDPSFEPVLIASIHNTSSELYASIKDGKVVVEKVSSSQRVLLQPVVAAEWRALADWCVQWLTGCSSIMWLLAARKLPLIMHNGLLDIMLVYKQFFGPLPDTLAEFKAAVAAEFPLCYDTKLLCIEMSHEHRENKAVAAALKFSSLASLHGGLSSSGLALYSPHVVHHERSKYNTGAAALHEAGYDAFLTGVCFIKLSHLHHALTLPSGCPRRPLEPREVVAALKHHCNKITLARAALPYLNLGGADPAGNRPPWIVVEYLKSSAADATMTTAVATKTTAAATRLTAAPATTTATSTRTTVATIRGAKGGHSVEVVTVDSSHSSVNHLQNSTIESKNIGNSKMITDLNEINNTIVNKEMSILKHKEYNNFIEVNNDRKNSSGNATWNKENQINRKETANHFHRWNKCENSFTYSRLLPHQFTPTTVEDLLSVLGSADVRRWRHNKMLVSAATRDGHRDILAHFRHPSLKVYHYQPGKRGWPAVAAIWSGLVVSSVLSAWLVWSGVKATK